MDRRDQMDLPGSPIAALRRFARSPEKKADQAVETCELCSARLAPRHPHLLDNQRNSIHCACNACALLFSGRPDAKYLRIPDRVARLENFSLTDAQWHSLNLPINLVFFLIRDGQPISCFPSPAGAVEATLPPDYWNKIVAANKELADLEPKVEAILVNRLENQRLAYRVPIDTCYRLVGLVRAHWRGFSGGDVLWNKLQEFFTELDASSISAGGAHA